MKQKTPSPSEVVSSEKTTEQIDLSVNEFGQIIRNIDLDHINAFLDEKVQDKKIDSNVSIE